MRISNRIPHGRRLVLTGVAVAALATGTSMAQAGAALAGSPRVQILPGTITTVAGGPGGPGAATKVAMNPIGLTYFKDHVYIADGLVQKLDDQGRVNTPAGALAEKGVALGDGGPSIDSSMDAYGAAVTVKGNIAIADAGNNRIRMAAAKTHRFYGVKMTNGYIYNVAGGGKPGFSGDGGRATSARLNGPRGVAVDVGQNLVIADTLNDRVRVVAAKTGTFYGQAMMFGHIYTVAGGGEGGLANGIPATSATLDQPDAVAVDAAGNLVISDSQDGLLRVVAVKTGTFYGQAMTARDIYTIAGGGAMGTASGVPATQATLSDPGGLWVDPAGVIVADTGDDLVRVAATRTGTFFGQAMTAGDIYTVAGNGKNGFSGDGGPATQARLKLPSGVAVDGSGNLLIADEANRRVRAVAATTGAFYAKKMTAGDIYTVAGNGQYLFSGDGGPATKAELSYPPAVSVDGAGNLVFADTENDQVRVVAASGGTFYGQAMTAGHVYSVAGNGTDGFSGDGGPATKAELSDICDVAIDGAGNLVIDDCDGNERVRVVAVKTGTFYAKKMTAGDIYTVAGNGKTGFSGDGGRATGAELDDPYGVSVDSAGNLVVADSLNERVRVVAAATGTFYGQAMTVGDIYTVAGNGTRGFSGDGGPATSAEFYDPAGVAVDSTGNLLIADPGNNRVRVVAAKGGTFYAVPMKAGHIYTVAGDGIEGFSGEGMDATIADLNQPEGVAMDGAGNLVIADTGNSRLRVVSG